MTQKREHQRQKKAEKQKQRREEIRRSGGASRPGLESQRAGVPGKRASAEQAAHWPLGDAYVSGNWHEQGAHVYAAITRRRDDGRVAAALFEIDLAEQGLIDCKTSTSLNDALMMAELGRRSEPEPMITVEPDLVAKIVQVGRDLAKRPPVGLDEALALIAGVDPTSYPGEILTGRPPPPEEKRQTGLFAWVSNLLTKKPQPTTDPTDP